MKQKNILEERREKRQERGLNEKKKKMKMKFKKKKKEKKQEEGSRAKG